MPQISSPRHFDRGQFHEGCWLIYWGLYKKVFVADNAARIVDKVYGSLDTSSGFHVLVATYAFAVQIYCDFSGYSDIARGAAKTLGFEISLNFDILTRPGTLKNSGADGTSAFHNGFVIISISRSAARYKEKAGSSST